MAIREKLVELLCKMISPTITVGEQADFLIANGVTVQEWIPASEPPKVYRDEYGIPIPFLAYTEDKSPFITYFVDGKHWGRFGQDLKVTHWMPLPEPPKGE